MREEKACSKCKLLKPLTAFSRNKKCRGGRLPQCKECAKLQKKQWDADNADHCKEYGQKYYAENAETRRSKRREAYRADPERARREAEQYRIANRALINEKARKAHAANRERSRARNRQWKTKAGYNAGELRRERYLANAESEKAGRKSYDARYPEKRRLFNQRRRARKSNATGFHTRAEWIALVEHFSGNCVCCKKHFGLGRLTEDHVIPLSRGGSDLIENIQPLCGPCNSRKKDRSTDYRDSFGAAAGGANAA